MKLLTKIQNLITNKKRSDTVGYHTYLIQFSCEDKYMCNDTKYLSLDLLVGYWVELINIWKVFITEYL